MNIVEVLMLIKQVFVIIAAIMVYMRFLMPIFGAVSFFATKQFPKAKKNHKYAIMIAARNEEAVIGNLIDSINAQDYPSELVTVFVVADNCTDNTASIARSHGAVCYERFDSEHRTKGYALEFLVDNIKNDYGIESFDAYFIFDADNLLKKDYLARMNEAFDSGEKIVTSYRNTKNFGDNWIAASYGIHWIRTIRYEHRAKSVLGLATRIQGTGFMFAAEIIKDGWHYVTFTEDRAFGADAVVSGYRISYCDKAEFYDEQPTSLRIAMRQRIRWGKGHLQAFAESGFKLLAHVFVSTKNPPEYPKSVPNDRKVTDDTAENMFSDSLLALRWLVNFRIRSVTDALLIPVKLLLLPFMLVLFAIASLLYGLVQGIEALLRCLKRCSGVHRFLNSRFLKGLRLRVLSYDMFNITFPNNLINIMLCLLGLVVDVALVCLTGSILTMWHIPIMTFLLAYAGVYIGNILLGVLIFVVDRRRIVPIPLYKKIFYCLVWPVFDIIGELSVLIAFFTKVEWKPIPHKVSVKIEDISSNK